MRSCIVLVLLLVPCVVGQRIEAQTVPDSNADSGSGKDSSSAGAPDPKGNDDSLSLLPKPANLTAARFSDERLSSVLWNGVAGSAMPPCRQLPAEDLRALIAYIQSLHAPGAAPGMQETASLDLGKALFVGVDSGRVTDKRKLQEGKRA